ncbi:MAG: hypothetical protein Q8P11_03670 [bacterium]|nr:hypothetical protein [bacterium]
MSALQETFERVEKKRDEQRKLRAQIKEAQDGSPSYKRIKEEARALKARKGTVEQELHNEFFSEYERLDKLARDIKDDTQMLADLALTRIAKGQTVEVRGHDEVDYVPLFSVRFKKVT